MKWTAIIFALAVTLLIAACEKPPAPKPTPPAPDKPLIVVVPGLGGPDDAILAARLTADFPQANVVNFGTGNDSFLADVKGYIDAAPHTTLITIGFSYGTDTLNKIIGSLGPVALDVKLDPVPRAWFTTYKITPNVGRTVVVAGDFIGLIRAPIDGKYDEFKVHVGHVQIPNDPRTIAVVHDAVARALEKP